MIKVKFGILGVGELGLQHAKNIQFRIPNAELIAVCVRTTEKIDRLQKELEVPYGYTDYQEMLHNPELDAVVIASSTTAHFEHAMAAIRAGLHIFIEKPIGMTVDECVKLEEAAKNSGRLFMVGFMRRHDPAYADAKRRIEAGEIGQPILYRGYSLDPVWVAEYLAKRAEQNGCWFLDMGVHDYDLARWFLGSEPESVFACGGAYMYPIFEKTKDIDNGYALMKFHNGSAAFFYEGRTAPHGSHVESEIIGTEGSIRINSIPAKNRSVIYNENGVSVQCFSTYLERWAEAFYRELQSFADAILAGHTNVGANAHDGTLATTMGLAVQKSYESNSLVEII